MPAQCANQGRVWQVWQWVPACQVGARNVRLERLAEIARILRPGGLFAAYDYDWPPALHWELERAYQEMDERFDALVRERGIALDVQRWSKEQHLERMRESGHFRFTRELLVHNV